MLTDFERLALQIRTCRRCSLAEKRLLAVPGEIRTVATSRSVGDFEAIRIALLAEAPGADEDKTGRPMVGAAGKLLMRLLAEAGYSNDTLLITNRVRCRPPRNRLSDAPDALTACNHWTQAEILAYDPIVVVLLGATAIHTVFGPTAAVGIFRGKVRSTGRDHEYGARTWVATYHPAAVFRAGEGRQELEEIIVGDLRLAREIANEDCSL